MAVVCDNAESYFIKFLEEHRKTAGGWMIMRWSLSDKLNHAQLVDAPDKLDEFLSKMKDECSKLLEEVEKRLTGYKTNIIYRFLDSDIIAVVSPSNEEEKASLYALHRELSEKHEYKDLFTFDGLNTAYYNYQKLSEKKVLAVKRFEAYRAMADQGRIENIEAIRERRQMPLVLIIEDDHYTSAYASNILNKDYDIVHAKSGEEGVLGYVEHAPDIVFLDIHLPGLSGHEVLQSIFKIEADAYVIMFSVDTVEKNIVAALKMGAAGFLKKPFSKDRLLHAAAKSPFLQPKPEKDEGDDVMLF